MRAWISLGVLFALVAGLGAWVYFRPAPGATATHALSELKPEQVKRITIEHASGPPAVLERTDGRWRIVAPFAARADAVQVERLFGILEARSAVRYPPSDLARYGLDAPPTKLTLGEQRFAYGAVNTTTREQYVLTRDAVYAIPLAQRTAVPRDAAALVSRSLFDATEVPVRIEGPGFAATLSDGAWTITPAPEGAGPDERNAWADAWRNATAVQAARYEGQPASENVTVGLKDGRTLTLPILQREPELVLARPDEGLQFHFFAQTAKRLLEPARPRN